LTRLGIETKNIKMRVESLASRLEFNERRARALESVVVYKPLTEDDRSDAAPGDVSRPKTTSAGFAPVQGAGEAGQAPAGSGAFGGGPAEGPGQRSRRRRRRRGRRSGVSASAIMGTGAQIEPSATPTDQPAPTAHETHAETAETVERAL